MPDPYAPVALDRRRRGCGADRRSGPTGRAPDTGLATRAGGVVRRRLHRKILERGRRRTLPSRLDHSAADGSVCGRPRREPLVECDAARHGNSSGDEVRLPVCLDSRVVRLAAVQRRVRNQAGERVGDVGGEEVDGVLVAHGRGAEILRRHYGEVPVQT